ncbi:anthranilate 1,2-dioxygenase electron transfer component AntC [Pseudomonas tohonis]|uniref:anthranilate 1,2-dioxygenase electron transfer component AntC n=1 Tax=Pseudomonas tohonis TaxID=2725477 RepID=UPI001F36E829|nr:anthranilate 1,2-dioxygenase electron transfer component AntC [Pseudomonas tohonis]
MNHKVAISFADGKTHFFPIKGGELLLDAALRNGINIPLDCREGVCGTCMGRCESGQYSLDYVDEEALSPSDLQQRKVLACQTRVRSDAAFYFDFDSTLCSASGTRAVQARVSEVELLSASTALLHLEAGGDSPLDFLPGQYARLQVPGTEAHRAYSFANRPNAQNRLLFLIRLLPGGVMSDYLRERCQAGDEIRLEAPLGAFYLRQVERPLVLVAGGTGLSAFLGMLDELAERGCDQPVRLYHGVRQPADLCELARIRGYAERIPGFAFIPVVSDAAPGWDGKRGYVSEHLDPEHLRAAPFDMYLCGPPPMIESMKAWLQENALDGNPLYLEKFTESGT